MRVPRAVVPLFEALALSPDPVFITDRHNRIVFWNRSAERLLGYTEEEMVGAACAGALEGCDVYGNRYCSDSCPVTQIAARGETVRHFDLRLRSKDRSTQSVDVSILNFALDPPDGFLLAHILKPSRAVETAARPIEGEGPAPRSALASVRESPDVRARKLTGREVEVLGMLAAGHPTAEIASRLHISTLTSRNHIQNILDKLEVHSKAEAVAFAFQKHLV
ncbi:MAG TPA: LuxR C-terminal-related transcriptional regulator [Candidatus Polarisedimenticolia bacterium]|nr:LuxR C-terminal-related transcriptional regulator [Candidatus Polarisedimenticolia bacterium]